MKWIVQLDYEFGEIEPNSIYFRRVCSDDMEYGSAYDTKREALEAFGQGQYAINQLRKEREAEQKKEEGWDKAIKEAKEKYGYGKPKEEVDVVRDFSPEELEKRFGGWNEAIREAHKSPIEKQFEKIEKRLEALEKKSEKMRESLCFPKGVLLANVADTICHDADLFNKINERQRTNEESLAKMENRLTEIEGVLTSIGSPDYYLRKKVEELEKGLEGLNTTFRLFSKNEIERSAVLEKNIDKLSEKVFGSIEGKNT